MACRIPGPRDGATAVRRRRTRSVSRETTTLARGALRPTPWLPPSRVSIGFTPAHPGYREPGQAAGPPRSASFRCPCPSRTRRRGARGHSAPLEDAPTAPDDALDVRSTGARRSSRTGAGPSPREPTAAGLRRTSMPSTRSAPRSEPPRPRSPTTHGTMWPSRAVERREPSSPSRSCRAAARRVRAGPAPPAPRKARGPLPRRPRGSARSRRRSYAPGSRAR